MARLVVKSLDQLHRQVIACDRCQRLRTYCGEIAAAKRKSFSDWDYWGKPVPGFGDPRARLIVVGLAPGAHGGNRTGRVFTGDRSGDWLYRALHKAGFANQALSQHRDDGLTLRDCYITVGVRCAPPANKPLPREIVKCRPHLVRDLELLTRAKIIVCLGKLAWDMVLAALDEKGSKFAHGAERGLARYTLLGS